MRGALLLMLVTAGWAWCATATAQQTRPVEEALVIAMGGDDCFKPAAMSVYIVGWLGQSDIDERVQIVVDGGPPLSFAIKREEDLVAQRRFDVLPNGCEGRRAAVSLAIAIAIDNTVLRTLGIAEPEPPPAQPQPAPEPEVAAPEPDNEWHASLSLGPGINVGVLPAWGPDGSLRLELRRGERWGVAARAWATVEREFRVGQGRARTQMTGLSVGGCMHRPLQGARLSGCLGLSGSLLSAEGAKGFGELRSTALPWLAAQASLAARFWADKPAGLRASADGIVPIVRPQLQVLSDQGGEVAAARSLPTAGARLQIAVEVDLR